MRVNGRPVTRGEVLRERREAVALFLQALGGLRVEDLVKAKAKLQSARVRADLVSLTLAGLPSDERIQAAAPGCADLHSLVLTLGGKDLWEQPNKREEAIHLVAHLRQRVDALGIQFEVQ
jgi:hypothetical protein